MDVCPCGCLSMWICTGPVQPTAGNLLQQGWTRWSLQVPSNSYNSVILCTLWSTVLSTLKWKNHTKQTRTSPLVFCNFLPPKSPPTLTLTACHSPVLCSHRRTQSICYATPRVKGTAWAQHHRDVLDKVLPGWVQCCQALSKCSISSRAEAPCPRSYLAQLQDKGHPSSSSTLGNTLLCRVDFWQQKLLLSFPAMQSCSRMSRVSANPSEDAVP